MRDCGAGTWMGNTDMTKQIGTLDNKADDKIFSYQDYTREDFIISYPIWKQV